MTISANYIHVSLIMDLLMLALMLGLLFTHTTTTVMMVSTERATATARAATIMAIELMESSDWSFPSESCDTCNSKCSAYCYSN